MKHLILLSVLILFTSCHWRMKNPQAPAVTEFQINEHDYYRIYFSGDQSTSVIHNPECKKCLNIFD